MNSCFKIGVLSDTHGPVPSWVVEILKKEKVNHIIHAGDIISDSVIPALKKIAPVTYVNGNMDGYTATRKSSVFTHKNVLLYVIHDLYKLDINPTSVQIDIVICGHTHKPDIKTTDGVLYINPGSTSFPRGENRPSVAIIDIYSKQKIMPYIIYKPKDIL
jgi:putative phosphoesterase